MSDWIKVIILGIVEGVTEFLPISSTGHLIVVSAFLGFASDRPDFQNSFNIIIQLGAVIAVALYYFRDLLRKLIAATNDASARRFWLAVLIAIIPAGLLGFLLGDKITELLFDPLVVAFTLIAGGFVFLWIEWSKIAQRASTTDERQITLKQAGIVGVAQVASLIPGTSRSGSAIVGGLLAGLNREIATKFSFYLAIPTLGGATVYDFLKYRENFSGDDFGYLFLGALVSGLVALISIHLLLRYVSRHSFVIFGYYRILAGIIILLLVALGRL